MPWLRFKIMGFTLNALKKINSSIKSILVLLFLLNSSTLFASDNFSTNFNRTDFIILSVFSTSVLLILLALNLAISVLKNENRQGQENLAGRSVIAEKVKSTIEEFNEIKWVCFYIALIFAFLYMSYAFVKGTSWESHITEWLNIIVRWVHVVFGIAWIGASFYFNFLENSLNRTKGLRDGIAGNLWAVHGGGFYYLEKYKTAPAEIPKDLHWFKYEAYFTWLSGVVLLVIVYYLDAKAYLLDPSVMDISADTGVLIGIGSLITGWIVYDLLCKSPLSKKPLLFGFILFLFIAATAWFFSSVFSSRAAYIHVGALIGTLMVGNVFRVIIPSQKAMVKAGKEGKPVDPSLGKKALLRSLHNNYFTLPVIFIMISNHFPSTYGNAFNWIVLIGISLVSVLVKHYLNLKEKGEKAVWILPVAVVGMIALAIVTAPKTKSVCKEDGSVSFMEVNNIITKRCIQCHSSNPTDDVLTTAPNAITFDEPANIIKFSDRIFARTVATQTMPQGNKTNMTQEERDLIQCWIEQGAKGE